MDPGELVFYAESLQALIGLNFLSPLLLILKVLNSLRSLLAAECLFHFTTWFLLKELLFLFVGA
jgi:hypothetical protein